MFYIDIFLIFSFHFFNHRIIIIHNIISVSKKTFSNQKNKNILLNCTITINEIKKTKKKKKYIVDKYYLIKETKVKDLFLQTSSIGERKKKKPQNN